MDGPTSAETPRRFSLHTFYPLFLILTTFLIRWPLLDIPLERDEGEYAYVASFPLNEVAPYRDSANHRGPLPFFIYKLIFALLGQSVSAIHGFLTFYVILEVLAVYALARALFRPVSAPFFAALTYALLASEPLTGLGSAANLEIFMVLPATLGALCLITAVRKDRRSFYFLAGLFVGAAGMCKQTAFLEGAFFLVYLLRVPRNNVTLKNRLPRAALYGAGCLGVPLAFCALFFSYGALGDFLFWTFVSPWRYAKSATVPLLGLLQYWWHVFFWRAIQGYGWGIAAFVAGIMTLWRKAQSSAGPKEEEPLWAEGLDSPAFLVIGWFAAAFLGILSSMRFYPHYYLEAYPPVSLIAGIGAWRFIKRTLPGFRKISPGLPFDNAEPVFHLNCALLIIVIPLIARADFWAASPDMRSRIVYGRQPFPEAEEIGRYLRENSGPEDRIFIFGQEPQILFHARRKSATRHLMTAMLLPGSAGAQEQRLILEAARSGPKFIVFVNLLESLALSGSSERDLFLYHGVQDLVSKDYFLDGWMVLEWEKEKDLAFWGRDAIKDLPPELMQRLGELRTVSIYRKKDAG